MEKSSLIFVRTLRELCGEYRPEETEPDKRFVLTAGEIDVPVFAGTQTPAQYPEIRIDPFFLEHTDYKGPGYSYAKGTGPTQDPNVMYRQRGLDLFLRDIISEIYIYAKSLEEVLVIKDALFQRIMSFGLMEHAEVKILDDWELLDPEDEDANVYINGNYDTGLSIIKVLRGENCLLKTSEYETHSESWFWDGDILYVHTDFPIEDLNFLKNTNNGMVFHDDTDLFGRGFLNLDIISNEQKSDRDPYVSKWCMRLRSRYQDTIDLDMGESFAKVNVNGKTEEGEEG